MGPWDKRDDMIVHESEPYNAEPPPGALADRILTPLDSFYSRNHGPVPVIDPQAWRLRIRGLADHDLDLSLEDLRSRFAPRTITATLQCAGNRRDGLIEVRDIPGEAPWGPGATSTAEWDGVSLAEVLRAAGPRPGAAHVAFSAPDIAPGARPPQPYGGSVPLSKALGGEVLLAWAMNGQPLPPVHGGPVRVVVPGYIGARSVKWVEQVTIQDHPSDNYFQATAYRLLPAGADPAAARPGDGLSLGAVAVSSAILRPGPGAVLPAGPGAGHRIRLRRRRPRHRPRRRLHGRRPHLAAGQPRPRCRALGLAAVARHHHRPGRGHRDHRPRLGHLRRRPARVPRPPVEPQGIRQQLLGPRPRHRALGAPASARPAAVTPRSPDASQSRRDQRRARAGQHAGRRTRDQGAIAELLFQNYYRQRRVEPGFRADR